MAKQPWWKQGLIFVGVLVVLYFSRTFLPQDKAGEGKGATKTTANGTSGGEAAKADTPTPGTSKADPPTKAPEPANKPATKPAAPPAAKSQPTPTPVTPPAAKKTPKRDTTRTSSALPSKLSARKLKAVADSGDKIIEQAYRAKRSKVWVESVSRVIKLFRDDNVGHRHQLFLVKLANDLTLKVAHNIDLAPRVPVKVGDTLHMRGRYEYNDKGGVMHWTHHDPQNRGPGGWIWHKGKCYK